MGCSQIQVKEIQLENADCVIFINSEVCIVRFFLFCLYFVFILFIFKTIQSKMSGKGEEKCQFYSVRPLILFS